MPLSEKTEFHQWHNFIHFYGDRHRPIDHDNKPEMNTPERLEAWGKMVAFYLNILSKGHGSPQFQYAPDTLPAHSGLSWASEYRPKSICGGWVVYNTPLTEIEPESLGIWLRQCLEHPERVRVWLGDNDWIFGSKDPEGVFKYTLGFARHHKITLPSLYQG